MSKRFPRVSLFSVAALLAAPALSLATDYYVSPNGSGNGSMSSPMSINTLCGGSSGVQPGDTAWLRGGSYGSYGNSTINCQLNGTASAPIKVRAYPGERAAILGGLGVYSNYVWYWGIEIYNNFTRSTSECGSFPSIKPPDGVFFNQGSTGNKFINMIIHDVANGISDQQEAIGTEDYGNILYNIGWSSSCDRGHGHVLYLQNNDSSVKLVQDNIGYNAFDIGMQAYSGANNVSNIWFVGNAFWNSGLPGGHRVDNMYIGDSASPKQNILVQDSVMYNPLDASSSETGYNEMGSGSNYDITVKNNYWIGAVPTGYVTLLMTGWQTSNVTGNMFVGPLSISGIGSYNWSGNSYYKSAPPSGVDSGSPVSSNYPTGVRVIVRPNKYEQGRANIYVLNFDKNSSVSVDLSNSGLTIGQSYQIVDAQNFWGGPVVTGTYNGGSVTLPMNLSAVSQIINYTTPAHTSSEFGAFVVLPTSGATSTPATQSVSVSVSPTSATVNPGGTQQFTASVSGNSNTAVTWSASPSTGSISSTGLYTAPSSVSSQTTVTVTATSQADSTKSASATITLNASASTSTSSSTGTNGTGASWWTFDSGDIQGSTAIDGSGRGLNGVISNAVSVAGRINQALAFNGSNSVVTVNSNPALDLVNNMTVSTWIKTTNSSRTEDFIGKYDASGSEYGWILKTLSTGVVGLRVGGYNTANGVRDVADTTRINDGNWHHVAVVITLGSSVQFYVDGVLSSTQGLPTIASAASNAPMWIGTIPFTYFGMPFTGALDNVRVDAAALTASQIASMVSNAGSGGTTTAVAVSVSVAPTSATMYAGASQQFTATVSGTTNTAVTWSVNNGLGSVSSSGLYTAPSSVSSPATVVVTATSQADTTKSGSATITINPTTAATSPTSSGVAASYSFDTAAISGTTVLDGSGNGLNGILNNTTAVTGKVNQALAFNGINSVVTVPSNSKLDLVNSMTISAWVKTTNNSRTEDFIGKYDATASEYGWMVKILSSGVVGLRVGGNNTANGVREVADTTPVNDGTWHHVAVVVNLGSNVQFYVDGSLRSTQSLPTTAYPTTASMWIGAIPFTYYGMPFTGSLDQVRIDAQALSASAIASLASGASTSSSTVSVSVSPNGATVASGGTQQFTASVSGSSNTAVTWSVSASGGSISSSGLYTAPSVSSQQVFTVTATSQADPTKSAGVNVTVNPASSGTTPTSSTGASAFWTFDTADLSGSTVLDKSGNNLNGIASGVASVAGHSNQAFAFNGSSSAVTVAANSKLDLVSSMTIAAWVRTTNSSRNETVIGKYDATGTEWGWIVKTLSTGVVGLRLGGNNVIGTRDVADTTPINDGNWHHVAVVINLGSNVQFYIDGTLRSTQPMLSVAQTNTMPLYMGTLPFTYYGMPFTGSLDSVQVYSQALSASAIAQLAL